MKNPIGCYVLCCLLFSGCATANLFPEDFEVTEDDTQQGKIILLKSLQKRDPQDVWSRMTFMKVVAKDTWQSQTVRLFTPIPQAAQQVQFAFNLTNDDAFMKFLDGDKAGHIIGVEAGGTYFVTKGKRQDKSSQRVDNYLPPAKGYFLWPQTVQNLSNVSYLGEQELGLHRYYKIFAENDIDQYIVWVNQQTLLIDYIEFTLQKLLKSYRGVVQYREYRDAGGLLLPYEIILLDSLTTLSYSHKFNAQIITLE